RSSSAPPGMRSAPLPAPATHRWCMPASDAAAAAPLSCLACDEGLTLRQVQQHIEAAVEHGVVACVADAKVRVALAEDRAGNDQQVTGDGFFDKLRRRELEALGHLGESVERAAG